MEMAHKVYRFRMKNLQLAVLGCTSIVLQHREEPSIAGVCPTREFVLHHVHPCSTRWGMWCYATMPFSWEKLTPSPTVPPDSPSKWISTAQLCALLASVMKLPLCAATFAGALNGNGRSRLKLSNQWSQCVVEIVKIYRNSVWPS